MASTTTTHTRFCATFCGEASQLFTLKLPVHVGVRPPLTRSARVGAGFRWRWRCARPATPCAAGTAELCLFLSDQHMLPTSAKICQTRGRLGQLRPDIARLVCPAPLGRTPGLRGRAAARIERGRAAPVGSGSVRGSTCRPRAAPGSRGRAAAARAGPGARLAAPPLPPQPRRGPRGRSLRMGGRREALGGVCGGSSGNPPRG